MLLALFTSTCFARTWSSLASFQSYIDTMSQKSWNATWIFNVKHASRKNFSPLFKINLQNTGSIFKLDSTRHWRCHLYVSHRRRKETAAKLLRCIRSALNTRASSLCSRYRVETDPKRFVDSQDLSKTIWIQWTKAYLFIFLVCDVRNGRLHPLQAFCTHNAT